MEIVFLGTGGGRINLIKQIRATGGFRINSESAAIHVDPGPGALVHSVNLKQDPLKLDAVIVSHIHVDHANDAGVLLEAMSKHTLKKQGILIGSKSVIEGRKNDRGVSLYHQNLISDVYIARFGDKRKFITKKGSFEIEIIKTKHDDETGFGFKLKIDKKIIGYTSDTEYFDGIGEAYIGCDYLIINCLKPVNDKYVGHLTSNDAIKLIKTARPKLAILNHIGMKMINFGPEKETKRIEQETGVLTIMPQDGQSISLIKQK